MSAALDLSAAASPKLSVVAAFLAGASVSTPAGATVAGSLQEQQR